MTRPSQRSMAFFAAALVAALAIWGTSLARAEKQGTTQNSAEECKMDPVAQSICVYDLILDDIRDNYRQRGGGGISGIVQTSTTGFTARLEQEGRVDVRSYEIRFEADGRPAIVSVTEATETM
ncbi:MAG: hypothetical protein JNJ84_04555 [Rhodobacteraceae bacterium]|uniref:hypothetical protein n=1 Tax=Tabrizicola sp. SY72 TaxID=2741673 RepID=UPI0015719345|nr:hypothetical protein [Tabrizicola sp. SY72]MBL9055530.1 hypothetical protein [Paracoccaceae bacterium]NTT87097.1 hypothetical protein [Tabrizicola sp. SY72]